MTQYLPPNLLALFAPRDPIPYMTPLDKLPHEKKLTPYRGVAQFLQEFEDPKETPPPTRVETKDERKERKRRERAEQVAYKLEQDLALWDPVNDPTILGDPYKALFVARINYDTSESKLRREFEAYGPVKQIKLVHNQLNGKPRGYAFLEFEHERDMHSAYKHADGKKIDGRRVLVDIERGRTIKGWRPRRLGGGLGGTRKGGPDVNTKYSGREENSSINRDREGGERSRSRERERGDRGDTRGGDRGDNRENRGGDRGDREKERENRRRRSRSPRERRRRSRSPRERRRRSRSRDRAGKGREAIIEESGDMDKEREKKRRRSRSRDRTDRTERPDRPDRPDRQKRSRSRDRKRSRRSRSRDRSRRSRDRGAEEGAGPRQDGDGYGQEGYDPDLVIKQEENGDDEGYGQYSGPVPPQDPERAETFKKQYSDQEYDDNQGSPDQSFNEYSNNGSGQHAYGPPPPEAEYTE